jgi:hypothetical protein
MQERWGRFKTQADWLSAEQALLAGKDLVSVLG